MIVYCVNDPAVMQAWAADQKVGDSYITFMSDAAGLLTDALDVRMVHPGTQRQASPPYAPDASDFHHIDGSTAVSTKQFVAVGGGNALELVDATPPSSQPPTGSKFIEGNSHLSYSYHLFN